MAFREVPVCAKYERSCGLWRRAAVGVGSQDRAALCGGAKGLRLVQEAGEDHLDET